MAVAVLVADTAVLELFILLFFDLIFVFVCVFAEIDDVPDPVPLRIFLLPLPIVGGRPEV